MADEEKVKGYQRTTKSGQVITVKEHSRAGNSEAASAALVLPGRPPVAAKQGSFANGRSIPNIWVEGPKSPKSVKSPQAEAEALKKEFLPEQGTPDPKEVQSVAEALKKEFLSEKSQKVIQAAAQILDENTVGL